MFMELVVAEEVLPQVQLIHLGEHDLGQVPSLELIGGLQSDIALIHQLVPAPRLVLGCAIQN